MARGPGFDMSGFDYVAPHNASFRIVSAYQPATDSIASRIDVKVDGHQFVAGFSSSPPVPPQPGDRILANDDLITPSAGVVGCLNMKAPLGQIIAALKELVADLEDHQDRQATARDAEILNAMRKVDNAMGAIPGPGSHGYRSGRD